MNRLQLLLVKLAEEAAEVAHIASKAQQFGLEESCKNQPYTNAQQINHEIMDLITVVYMLNDEYDLGYVPCAEHIASKREKINRYALYSQQLGLLDNSKKL